MKQFCAFCWFSVVNKSLWFFTYIHNWYTHRD